MKQTILPVIMAGIILSFLTYLIQWPPSRAEFDVLEANVSHMKNDLKELKDGQKKILEYLVR